MSFSLESLMAGMRRNGALKAFSVLFACGLWAFVNLGEVDAEKTLELPLELSSIPEALIVTSRLPKSVEVRLRGPRTILGTIDQGRRPLSLDLSTIRPGRTTLRIDSQMLAFPRGVHIVRISPSQLSLDVDRLREKRVAVEIDTLGRLEQGLEIARGSVEPPSVTIRGPASFVGPIRSVRAEWPTDVAAAGTYTLELSVPRPDDDVVVDPVTVTATITVRDVLAERDFEDVPVAVVGAELDPTVQPSRVTVRVRGPEQALGRLVLAPGAIFVEASDLEPGQHHLTLQAAPPDRFTVVETTPSKVLLTLSRPVRTR